jgi:hypothetical protein
MLKAKGEDPFKEATTTLDVLALVGTDMMGRVLKLHS